MTHYLPIIISSFIFITITILVAYFKLRNCCDNKNRIIVGTSKYIFGATNLTPCRNELKGKVKKSNAMFAHAIEDGPKWSESDLLVINKDFGTFENDSYYILKFAEDQYRIAKCIDNYDPISPIFDGGETFLAHEPIGKVIGVWKISLNEYVWF